MLEKTLRICLICAALAVSDIESAVAKTAGPLFDGHDVLEISIRAPFAKIKRIRDREIAYDASLSYVSADGKTVNLDVKLAVRGHYRLKKNICKFPPLRVVFDKKRTKDTLFRKQKKLKLVTQCDPYSLYYSEYLLKEYLAYRILNHITDVSFRVRLVRINYSYADKPKRSTTNFGFFIEDKKRFAKRLGVKLYTAETDAVHLNSRHLNQVSLFQLLIGNVDWSATSGGTGDCCHNFKLFDAGGEDNILAVPYDFDLSGLVNAEYAVPDRNMNLKSVKQRRYRGYCRNNALLEENMNLFNEKKPEIIALVQQFTDLPKKPKKNSIRYINSFYRLINNPKSVARVVNPFCHKSDFVEVSPV